MISNLNLQYIKRQHIEFSMDGEEHMAHLLADRGFLVYFSREHPYHGYDLMVYPNVTVEVKTSSFRKVNQNLSGYQFNLFKQAHSRRIAEDIVVLLCQRTCSEAIPFIIPGEIVAWKNAISLAVENPMLYRGKWSHYCNAFDRILLAGGKRFKQGRVTADFQFFMEAHA